MLADIEEYIDAQEDGILASELLLNDLIEKGATEEEIMQFLAEYVGSIEALIAKDKTRAKKYLANLKDLMVVLEQNLLRQNALKPDLQNKLLQLQNNISGLMKENNPDKMLNFLKSGDLKNALEQTALQATKGIDLKSSSIAKSVEQVFDKLMERGRNLITPKQDILQSLQTLRNPANQAVSQEAARQLASFQQNIQAGNKANIVIPIRDFSVAQQVQQQPKTETKNTDTKQAQPQASEQKREEKLEQKTEHKAENKSEIKVVERVEQSSEPKLEIAKDKSGQFKNEVKPQLARAAETVKLQESKTETQAKTEDKPPTKICGGTNCHCQKTEQAPEKKTPPTLDPTKELPKEVQKEVMQTMAKNSEKITEQAKQADEQISAGANSLLSKLKASSQAR